MFEPVDRAGWWRLFRRVLTYYLVLLIGLAGVLLFAPAMEPYLPVGGLSTIGKAGTFEEVVRTYRDEASSEEVFRGVARLIEALTMSIAIVLTLATMLPVLWVHHATHSARRSKKQDKTVIETLLVLPVVITAVVLLIQNSIALAFGLAGIVAGVQFRNRLALSVDATYLFAAIAVGIASGVEAVGVAIVMCLWFCLTLIGLRIWQLDNVVTKDDG